MEVFPHLFVIIKEVFKGGDLIIEEDTIRSLQLKEPAGEGTDALHMLYEGIMVYGVLIAAGKLWAVGSIT